MTLRRTNSKPGQYTNAFASFSGNGVKRSCARCSKHVPTGQLRLMKPWGMACISCRGEKE